MKTEWRVRRGGKTWFCCTSEKDARDTADYYNARRDPGSDEYLPASRDVTEWRILDDGA